MSHIEPPSPFDLAMEAHERDHPNYVDGCRACVYRAREDAINALSHLYCNIHNHRGSARWLDWYRNAIEHAIQTLEANDD